MKRHWIVDLLILAGLAVCFLDESVRKTLPGTPVLITAVKDAIIFAAGLLILFRLRVIPNHYTKYFLPWIVLTFISSAWVYWRYGSAIVFMSTIRTYTLSVLIFVAGYYLASHPDLTRRAKYIFITGVLFAILIALLQEFMRDSLPSVFSTRIYKERHSLTKSLYVESIFASPQIMAEVFLVAFVWLYSYLMNSRSGKRIFIFFSLLFLCAVGIYLSRIRAAVLLTVFVIVFETSLIWKASPGYLKMTRPLRAVVAILLIIVFFSLYMIRIQTQKAERFNPRRERSFYSMLIDTEELAKRLSVPQRAIGNIKERHNAITGFGAGTGGRTATFMSDKVAPTVSDTGSFLIYHELGALGMAAFLLCYFGLIANSGLRFLRYNKRDDDFIPAFTVALTLFLWFFLKSHTCMANGASHIIWMASIGMSCSILDRRRLSSKVVLLQYGRDGKAVLGAKNYHPPVLSGQYKSR